MTNDKAQMPNKVQNPNDKTEKFQYLTCPTGHGSPVEVSRLLESYGEQVRRVGRRGVWISIVIWILAFGIQSLGLPSTFPFCHCEEPFSLPLRGAAGGEAILELNSKLEARNTKHKEGKS